MNRKTHFLAACISVICIFLYCPNLPAQQLLEFDQSIPIEGKSREVASDFGYIYIEEGRHYFLSNIGNKYLNLGPALEFEWSKDTLFYSIDHDSENKRQAIFVLDGQVDHIPFEDLGTKDGNSRGMVSYSGEEIKNIKGMKFECYKFTVTYKGHTEESRHQLLSKSIYLDQESKMPIEIVYHRKGDDNRSFSIKKIYSGRKAKRKVIRLTGKKSAEV